MMVEIDSFLAPERILLGWHCANKRQLFQELGAAASDATHTDPATVVTALNQREKLGTTGIGEGIAIPHARLKDLPGLLGFFVRLDEAVAYDALDDLPVDLVFLLLAPDEASGAQLKALARIARLLRDPFICARLRSETDSRQIFELLSGRKPAEGA